MRVIAAFVFTLALVSLAPAADIDWKTYGRRYGNVAVSLVVCNVLMRPAQTGSDRPGAKGLLHAGKGDRAGSLHRIVQSSLIVTYSGGNASIAAAGQ
jgi:hypothetical protein